MTHRRPGPRRPIESYIYGWISLGFIAAGFVLLLFSTAPALVMFILAGLFAVGQTWRNLNKGQR